MGSFSRRYLCLRCRQQQADQRRATSVPSAQQHTAIGPEAVPSYACTMEQLPFGGPSNCTLEQLPIGKAASPEVPIGKAASPVLPTAQPITEQLNEPMAQTMLDGQRLVGLSARSAAAAVCSARLQDAKLCNPYRYAQLRTGMPSVVSLFVFYYHIITIILINIIVIIILFRV